MTTSQCFISELLVSSACQADKRIQRRGRREECLWGNTPLICFDAVGQVSWAGDNQVRAPDVRRHQDLAVQTKTTITTFRVLPLKCQEESVDRVPDFSGLLLERCCHPVEGFRMKTEFLCLEVVRCWALQRCVTQRCLLGVVPSVFLLSLAVYFWPCCPWLQVNFFFLTNFKYLSFCGWKDNTSIYWCICRLFIYY